MNRKIITLFRIVFTLLFFIPIFGKAQLIIRTPKETYQFQGLKLNHISEHKKPKVGLVLSGGGSRGLAQIGVLRAFEKKKIPIDFIAGNSMGSVIGGLYASGYSTTELESIAIHTNWDEVLSFTEGTPRRELFTGQKRADEVGYLTIRFDGLQPIIPSSFSSGQGLFNYFMNLTLQALYHPDSSFDDLKIPFRAVAVDLITGKRILLDRGSLAEAMRSSITVPLLYTPLERDSMALVDGGLISNIPVDLARDAGCDIVIAVNSSSGFREADQMHAPWEIADQIMTIVMQAPNKLQLQNADVIITPDAGERIVSDFSNVDSLVAIGERAGEAQVNTILKLMKDKDIIERPPEEKIYQNATVQMSGKFIPEPDKEFIRSMHAEGKISSYEIEKTIHSLTLSGRYTDVYAEIFEENDSAKVIFHLTLMPIIQNVSFKGNSVIPDETIRHITQELEGTVFNYERIHGTLESVLRLYRSNQYSLARIARVMADEKTGNVEFTINEGIIHDVICTGNTRAKDYVIRREFPWKYGDVFNLYNAKTGLSNISSTGLFEYILMDIGYKEEEPTVTLKVKERSAEFLRLGLHADNEHDLVGTVEFRDANFRGAGEDLSILLRYGSRDRQALAEYRANRIFRTYLTFDFKAYAYSRDIFTYTNEPTTSVDRWERMEEGKYRETRVGGSFTFGTQLARFGDITAEIRTERQRTSGISGKGYADEDYRFVGFKLQTTLDTENKFTFPTEGIYFTVAYENALKSLGSEVSFTKITASWSAYHTFFNKHTIHPHITLGFADETLPLAEQFSFGGLNSFFGLRENDKRGRQLFLGSVEYRLELPFKILFNTYLSGRYDLGTISTLPEELKLSSFQHGIGIQLGLDTPLGAAVFAAGKSFYFRRDITDSPISAGPMLFYFSIGPEL